MHFAHAILRAVELRSWIVRGANTGISGFVDPAGRVVAELPSFEEGVVFAEVHAAGAQVVEDDHGVAGLLERPQAVASDVAGSAGHEPGGHAQR